MRLCDHLAQAKEPLLIEDDRGVHRMPSSCDDAERMRSTPLRYVLDQSAAEHCFAVLTTDSGMFTPENAALRVPAESFWLEWAEAPVDRCGPLRKHGVLVDADRDGRRGSVRSFWLSDDDWLERGQAEMVFDFEGLPPATPTTVWVGARELGAVAPHVAARFDPEWAEHLGRSGPERWRLAAAEVFSKLWTDLAFTLLFSAVLASRSVETRSVALARLNAARSKRGRAPLLDHVDVRLSLSERLGAERSRAGGERATPRLHLVRGHMVSRSGKRFWRCTHMRGDLAAAPMARTVRVTGRL